MAALEARGLLDRAVEALPDDADAGRARAAAAGADPAGARRAARLRQDRAVARSRRQRRARRSLSRRASSSAISRRRCASASPSDIEAHRLRREIIATQLANALINRGGPTLLVAARDRTGASVAELTRAYAAVRDSFGLQDLHAEIDALDAKISGRLQLELYAIVQDVLGIASAGSPATFARRRAGRYRGALSNGICRARRNPALLLTRKSLKPIRDAGTAIEGRARSGTLAQRLAGCRRWRAPPTSC